MAGKRVKVILDKIRIMNVLDPYITGERELTFVSVVVPDHDDSRKHVILPPGEGHPVRDKLVQNEIILGTTLFDGIVKNRSLSISILGTEIGSFDPDDMLSRYHRVLSGDPDTLSRYHRVFSGDPDTWYGQYCPSDEYLGRKDVGDWALWYRIVGSRSM